MVVGVCIYMRDGSRSVYVRDGSRSVYMRDGSRSVYLMYSLTHQL